MYSSATRPTKGPQKLYSKIINKINNFPTEVKFGLHKTPKLNGKSQVIKVTSLNKNNKAVIISEQDDNSINHEYENVLVSNQASLPTKDIDLQSAFCLSLEDEIFEELEKVAHDEAKLNAALHNFDKILYEYNDRSITETSADINKMIPSRSCTNTPPHKTDLTKILHKSKTCSIIESRCILKKKSADATSCSSLDTTLSNICLARSLLNLKDLEDFAKSVACKRTNTNRNNYNTYKIKSSNNMASIKINIKSQLPRAKSVYDLGSSHQINAHNPCLRTNSGSKIPVSTSNSRSNSFIISSGSTTSLLSASALKLKSRPPCEPTRNLQKLRVSISTNSLYNKSTPRMQPSVSEINLKTSTKSYKKSRNNGDVLLDKCLEKGHEILKKVEELSVKTQPTKIKKNTNEVKTTMQTSCVTKSTNNADDANRYSNLSNKNMNKNNKKDCISPTTATTTINKQNSNEDNNLHNKSHKSNDITSLSATSNKNSLLSSSLNCRSNKQHNTALVSVHKRINNTLQPALPDVPIKTSMDPKNAVRVKSIVKNCVSSYENQNRINKVTVVNGNKPPTFSQKNEIMKLAEVKKINENNLHVSVITVSPPLQSPSLVSQNKLSPSTVIILPQNEKEYQSDYSDDSGNISNENEDIKTIPGKLTESLLEKFEQNIKKIDTKMLRNEIVITNENSAVELNDKKMIRTCIEIKPQVNKRCTSEVLFRSGVLNQLEAKRDELLSDRIIQLQAYCRGHLARKRMSQRRVQELAVRCIQRNVRAFLKVREWPWWRLLVRVTPLLNVHRTEEQLKIANSELQTLKAKLEKIEIDRTALKTENCKLESRLSEMTAELAEEHSSSNLIGERLDGETTERLRLEKEMKEYDMKYRNLQESSEKLEMELLCAKSDLNGDLDDDDHENDDNSNNVYRLKYERVARELEFTKKRLQTQHEHDLEQLIGLKKQLEKKLADAYEEVEEQRQVVGQWKRKAQKMTNEMNDLRMLLEEQNSRNNLLEKRQRKFDSECQALQDSARQEKLSKDRLSREKDVLIAEKFTLEQNLSDTRLELELKEEKYASLQRELEEMTFGGGTEEEIAQLKRSKMDLDRRCKEQEEELDEMAGQIQLLEQAKLRLEMSLETMRKEARKESQQRDDELEEIRGSSYKKIKTLECQLETEHEERTLLLREKHELERRLNNLEEQDRLDRVAEEAASQKMKRDLRKYKALLRDAQTQIERSKADSAGKAMIRQLKNQLEDAETARTMAMKARQTAEAELQDNQLMLEEAQRARYEAEEKATTAQRDRTELQAQIDENEEEMVELMKKYSATVKQLNSEQSAISEYEIKISELDSEKKSLKEQISELIARLENVESLGDSSTSIQNKRLELRTKELESRLEFEQTTRARLEVQLNRHKDALEKAQTEISQARTKEMHAQDSLKKSQKSLRELREELHSISNKEQEGLTKRKDLEKHLESVEAEAASARGDLRLALQRIADLQQAMEEGDSYHSESENSDSSIDSMSELNYRGHSSTLSQISDYQPRKNRTTASNGTESTTLCIREEKENTPRITLTTTSKSSRGGKITNGDDSVSNESSFA